MTHTELIPFVGHHSSIVIGKGGSTIKQLMRETGCFIKVEKPNSSAGRPLPFFVVQGPHEKAVNQATIRIQRLLMNSMMRNDKKYKDETGELSQQTQFLELKIADLEANGCDVEGDVDGASDEKDLWIERLTRKVTEKDQEIEALKKEIDRLKAENYAQDFTDIITQAKTDLERILGPGSAGTMPNVARSFAEMADDESDDDTDESEDEDDAINVDMGPPIVNGKTSRPLLRFKKA
jgi:hypothetical protein